MRQIEKMVLLQTLDHLWREHLVVLEHLRSVIGFRSYGQRDPLNEYKSESFQLFEAMLVNMREAVTGILMHSRCRHARGSVPAGGAAADAGPPCRSVHGRGRAGHGRCRAGGGAIMRMVGVRVGERRCKPGGRPPRVNPKDPSTWGKVSRNALCPCGSGKKYKHCHGKHD